MQSLCQAIVPAKLGKMLQFDGQCLSNEESNGTQKVPTLARLNTGERGPTDLLQNCFRGSLHFAPQGFPLCLQLSTRDGRFRVDPCSGISVNAGTKSGRWGSLTPRESKSDGKSGANEQRLSPRGIIPRGQGIGVK